MNKTLTHFFLLLLAGFLSCIPASLKAQDQEGRPGAFTVKNTSIYGLLSGVDVYSADVDEAFNDFNIEAFGRFPLPLAEDFSLYCGLGFSKLEGQVYDANVPPRTFYAANPFTYAVIMPAYKVNSDNKIAVWLQAGLGAGYLKSENPETQGMKLLVPVGVDFNYHFDPHWLFTTHVRFTFSSGDLDGTKRGDNPDYAKSDNLIGVVMGIGYMP